MQHSRFLVLTGHLNDYPLSDLVGILRHQKKTGRLLIEYPNSPASFFFSDGKLVDAQLDNLSGLQAICVALAQPPSSFNFNPLIRPTRQSIENSLQRVVSELLGCWGENDLEIEKIAPVQALAQPALPASPAAAFANAHGTNIDEVSMFLSLPPRTTANRYSRPILAMAAAGLLMLGLSTVIAVTGKFGRRALSVAVSPPSLQTSDDSAERASGGDRSHNPPKPEVPNNSRVQRIVAKGKDTAEGFPQSTRQQNQSSLVNKKEMEISEKVSAAALTANPDNKDSEKQTNEASTQTRSVKVVLQIENGRVAQASIANHRSGMEAYEALALRIARQRRYPSAGATQEIVMIKLSPPQ